MLTRESALFYWDALYGPEPVVGGDPVYSRDTAGWWFDGRLFRKSITGPGGLAAPRFEPVTLDGVKRPAMLLEPAATSKLGGIVGQWQGNGIVFDEGAEAGLIEGHGATRVIADSVTGAKFFYLDSPVVTGKSYTQTFIIKPEADWRWFQVTGSTGFASGDWRNFNLDTLDFGGGSSSNMIIAREKLAGGYVKIAVTMPATTTTSGRIIGCLLKSDQGARLPAETGDDVTGVLVTYCNLEESAFGTSPLIGPASTVRGADSFYWQGAPTAQAMARYTRLEVVGFDTATDGYFLQYGDGPPRWLLYSPGGSGGSLRTYHQNGSATVYATAAVGLAAGDDVEVFETLAADGKVRIAARLNGGSVTSQGFSGGAALTGAWNVPSLNLMNIGSAGRFAKHYALVATDFDADLSAADLTAAIDEAAAYTLGPAGDLLSA